jgi:hypothetical protein
MADKNIKNSKVKKKKKVLELKPTPTFINQVVTEPELVPKKKKKTE